MDTAPSQLTGTIPAEILTALEQTGRYEILHQISQNPGRKTFLALDQTHNQRVILKLLTFSQDFDWQDLKLFQREAEILQQLDHPALPQYLDSFDFETPRTKGIGLVQRYIEARSLQEHLGAGRSFSETDLQDIATQLLDILTYAHDLGIVHRDIKPSNILLGDDRSAHSVGQIYLIDFGSVQNLAAVQGGTITVVGTYGYMPPEQFGGKAVPASDLYGLGATLIYLLTGCHPAELPQDELRLQFEAQLQGDGLSDRWVTWLQQMVEPNVAQRFQSAAKAKAVLWEEMAIADALPSVLSHYPSPPATSAIQLSLDEQEALILEIPKRQVSLQLDAAARPHRLKSLAVWAIILFLFSATVTPLMIVVAGLTMALGLLFSMAESHPLVLAVILTSLGAVAIGAVIQYLKKRRRANPMTHIRIDAAHLILSNCPSQRIVKQLQQQSDYTFQRHHLWGLRQETQTSQLILRAKNLNLVIHARHDELDWLTEVLSQGLNLAIEEESVKTGDGSQGGVSR